MPKDKRRNIGRQSRSAHSVSAKATARVKMRDSMRKLALHLSRPDWWTAIFSGILAVTAVGALWYARDQIKETREESEVQIKEARQQAQIQHLLVLVNEFDQEPMATYRRGLAQKRLKGTDSDPMELYRLLDFFETIGVLVNRGYLNEEDVWTEFGHWILTVNADPAMRANIEVEQKGDPTEYAVYQSLVERLQRIDAAHHGLGSHGDIMAFYREELTIVGGTPIATHSRSTKQSK